MGFLKDPKGCLKMYQSLDFGDDYGIVGVFVCVFLVCV